MNSNLSFFPRKCDIPANLGLTVENIVYHKKLDALVKITGYSYRPLDVFKNECPPNVISTVDRLTRGIKAIQ